MTAIDATASVALLENNTAITTATGKNAVVFQAPKAGVIDKVEFMLGTAGQVTNGIKVSFQNVLGADGNPDGTQDQYRDITSGLTAATWIVPGLMTSDGTDTGTKRTVTRGETLCVVWEWVTFSAGNTASIRRHNAAPPPYFSKLPYPRVHNGTSWGGSTSFPFFILKYNDGTYETITPIHWPLSTANTLSITNATTPDEVGFVFTPTMPLKIDGIWLRGAFTANFSICHYVGSTLSEAKVFDGDVRGDGAASSQVALFKFDNEYELVPGTLYRGTVLPSDGTAFTLFEYAFTSAAVRQAIFAAGQFITTSRSDAGSFSNTIETIMPMMGYNVSAEGTYQAVDFPSGNVIVSRRFFG
jgi:hypothetical protein